MVEQPVISFSARVDVAVLRFTDSLLVSKFVLTAKRLHPNSGFPFSRNGWNSKPPMSRVEADLGSGGVTLFAVSIRDALTTSGFVHCSLTQHHHRLQLGTVQNHNFKQ